MNSNDIRTVTLRMNDENVAKKIENLNKRLDNARRIKAAPRREGAKLKFSVVIIAKPIVGRQDKGVLLVYQYLHACFPSASPRRGRFCNITTLQHYYIKVVLCFALDK